jgi:hypothetical protein
MRESLLPISKKLEKDILDKFDLESIIVPSTANLKKCLDCWIEVDKYSSYVIFKLKVSYKCLWWQSEKSISELRIWGKINSNDQDQFDYLVAIYLKIRNSIQQKQIVHDYDLHKEF